MIIVIVSETCDTCLFFMKELLPKLDYDKIVILSLSDMPEVLGVARLSKILKKRIPVPYIVYDTGDKFAHVTIPSLEILQSIIQDLKTRELNPDHSPDTAIKAINQIAHDNEGYNNEDINNKQIPSNKETPSLSISDLSSSSE